MFTQKYFQKEKQISTEQFIDKKDAQTYALEAKKSCVCVRRRSRSKKNFSHNIVNRSANIPYRSKKGSCLCKKKKKKEEFSIFHQENSQQKVCGLYFWKINKLSCPPPSCAFSAEIFIPLLFRFSSISFLPFQRIFYAFPSSTFGANFFAGLQNFWCYKIQTKMY